MSLLACRDSPLTPLDPTKLGAGSRSVSVDGRPVSAAKGVFREFHKIYKSYYSNWLSGQGTSETPSDPFICLHLHCQSRSYDVNVEPSKDEILFVDEAAVMQFLTELVEAAYGKVTAKQDQEQRPKHAEVAVPNSFDLLLAKRKPKEGSKLGAQQTGLNRNGACGLPPSEARRNSNLEQGIQGGITSEFEVVFSRNKASTSTTGALDASQNLRQRNESSRSDSESATKDFASDDEKELRRPSVTNPWSIAKLNASTPSPRKSLQVSQIGVEGRSSVGTHDDRETLLSPTLSQNSEPLFFQNPGPLMRRRQPIEAERPPFSEAVRGSPDRSSPGLGITPYLQPRSLGTPSPHEPLKALSTRENSKLRNMPKVTSQSRLSLGHVVPQMVTDDIESSLESSPISPGPSFLPSPFRTPAEKKQKTLGLRSPQALTPASSSPERQLPHVVRDSSAIEQLRVDRNPAPFQPLTTHPHPFTSSPNLTPSQLFASSQVSQRSESQVMDLGAIMDFEHRKKDTHAKHKKQLKLTRSNLNSGQLFQLQQQHGDHHVETREPTSQQAQQIATKRIGPAKPNPSIENILQRPSNATENQSPHRNRYEAARRALNPPFKPPIAPEAEPLSLSSTQPPPPEERPLAPLDHNDPRAYLIRHRAQGGDGSSHDQHSARNTLKPKRARTALLPLESLIPGSSPLGTVTRLSTLSSPTILRKRVKESSHYDAYISTGLNKFEAWSPDSRHVEVWEKKLADLVRERYISVVESEGNREERPVYSFNCRLQLRLRAHGERLA